MAACRLSALDLGQLADEALALRAQIDRRPRLAMFETRRQKVQERVGPCFLGSGQGLLGPRLRVQDGHQDVVGGRDRLIPARPLQWGDLLGTPGRMEANSLLGRRDRGLQVPQSVLRLRHDEPSGPFIVHGARLVVGGDRLRGEDLRLGLVLLAAPDHRLSQESISQTQRKLDLLEELPCASVSAESLLGLTHLGEDVPLITECVSLSSTVPELLEKLVGLLIGVESLPALA